MIDITSDTMNLKLNNDIKSSRVTVKSDSLVKEERRRTGRYIAILVGIMLFLLALYHAWVRRIPVVASLVVPALIMFIYVAWVLFTASRDKHRLLDLEAAMAAQNELEDDYNASDQNLEISVISSKEISNLNTPDERRWSDLSSALVKGGREHNGFIMPIILINDEPPEDTDQKWLNIVEKSTNNDKLKSFHNRKNFKRKYCRKRRYAAFKRSYSIG